MKKTILLAIISTMFLIALIASCSSSENTTSPTPELSLPVLTTNSTTAVTQTTAVSGGNITSSGNTTISARGICWAIAENPTTANSKTTETGTTGSFSSNLTSLLANTLYYVRAYATNTDGTAYGNQISFTTGTIPATLPIVTTTAVSVITFTTATTGGNVTSDGGGAISARGVCYAATVNPTITNNTVVATGTTGIFSSSVTTLSPGTTYYVRAYATNSAGTGYGNQVTFATTSNGPIGGNAICNGSQPTMVVPITSSTGKIWMDRNLGASRAATSRDDYQAYGCLYQYGRGNDGHASIEWNSSTTGTPVNGVTMVQSSSDTPPNALFITDDNFPGRWRVPNNLNLWQGVNGINNPCPSGYRIPTRAEMVAEFTAYGINNSTTAYNSIHKFTTPGYRQYYGSGLLNVTGETGWVANTGSTDVTQAGYSAFYSTGAVAGGFGSFTSGNSVRCIKN
jgi:hypothetical protein